MAATPYQAYGDNAVCRPGKRSATRQQNLSGAKTGRNIVVLPDGGCALSGLRE